MILLPTRKRLDNIKRFLTAYTETATAPVTLLIDQDDPTEYQEIVNNIPNWTTFICETEGRGAGPRLNEYFKTDPDQEWYGIMADDVVPMTHHWDKILIEECLPDKIAWGNDGIQGAGLPTHPFIGGDLCRKLGWIAHPDLRHCFVDNVWLDIANILKCGIYRGDVSLMHYHYINGRAEIDDTYKEQASTYEDQEAFKRIRENGYKFN